MSDVLHLDGNILEATRDGAHQEVWLDLIREGFGNKRDNHYYSKQLLESAAEQFSTAKMYVDHLDKETERKLQGAPRPVSHLGGRILETRIATDDNGKTVLQGRAEVAQPWLWQMIENDPGLLGVSINARGPSKEGLVENKKAKIVEGISHVRSVDWVTEAGAGGKVFQLVEAQIEAEMEAEGDEEVQEHDNVEPWDCPACGNEATEAVCEECSWVQEAADLAPVDLARLLEALSAEDVLKGGKAGLELDGDVTTEMAESWDLWTAFASEDPELAESLLEAWAPVLESALSEADEEDEEEPDEEDEDEPEEDEEGEDATEAKRGKAKPKGKKKGKPDFLKKKLGEDDDDDEEEARFEAAVEAEVTHRLELALTAAVERLQEEFDSQVEAMTESHAHDLEQVRQAARASELVHEAGFKPATAKSLSASFADIFCEAAGDLSADQVLEARVNEAIAERRAEIESYRTPAKGSTVKVRGIQESASDATGTDAPETQRTGTRRTAPLDDQINQMLGIQEPAKSGAGAE